ncbi:hypothetical protein HELRODRAFT_135237, partial [Helobdella robusta]|uniref:TdIF1 C-terminal domain-containing protein n=1 Tax=Helobdella robusta TaxID=6412 RepID=T1EI78_HELRO
QWNPKRLTAETEFIMGSKANKALGLGATRGRVYMKHPDLFKYTSDQDDKQWLVENRYMSATGGKTYILILDDIRELAHTDEYRDCPGLALNELVGFTVPIRMIKKMQDHMNSQRTD